MRADFAVKARVGVKRGVGTREGPAGAVPAIDLHALAYTRELIRLPAGTFTLSHCGDGRSASRPPAISEVPVKSSSAKAVKLIVRTSP